MHDSVIGGDNFGGRRSDDTDDLDCRMRAMFRRRRKQHPTLVCELNIRSASFFWHHIATCTVYLNCLVIDVGNGSRRLLLSTCATLSQRLAQSTHTRLAPRNHGHQRRTTALTKSRPIPSLEVAVVAVAGDSAPRMAAAVAVGEQGFHDCDENFSEHMMHIIHAPHHSSNYS